MAHTRERTFWLGYAAAWLPAVAVYAFAFLLQGRLDGPLVAAASLANVLPEALLGVGVVHACRRLFVPPARRRWILLAGLALAFIGTATALKTAVGVAVLRLDGHEVSWASYDRGIVVWQCFLSALAFALIASVTNALGAARRLRAEEERRADAELARVRSELKALRSQLNPHFLANALHSLGGLVRENPDAAGRALEELGDLLHYSLRVQDAREEGVLLAEEWEFVRAYLALEQLRLGPRLAVDLDASAEALQCVVPAFVLQPLAENAVHHGVGTRVDGGTVRVRARLDGLALELQVQDDGPGATPRATRGTGKGLDLVRARLRALYGDAGQLSVAVGAGGGWTTTLRLPCALDEP